MPGLATVHPRVPSHISYFACPRTIFFVNISNPSKAVDMAQSGDLGTYKQGHSNYTTATHEKRRADSDAAFVLPHIKKTDCILDVGCGPGTITTGFARYAGEGAVVGLDVSGSVLEKARALAAEAGVPTEGPGSVTFVQGNILKGLPYPDDTFDIVYCSQLFGHIPPPDLPRQALGEMRRVLKPGGILASRHAAAQHFFPKSLDLDRLWVGNLTKALLPGAPADADATGASMPALYRSVGFDAEGGKVQIGVGNMVSWGPESRRWLAWRAAGQLKPGDPLYQSWLDAGITVEEIQETLDAVEKWAETEDAWFASLQCEVLGWK
ncbi:putative arsenite methyltransferase [Thozetella sp. PMI_491]|nr:putative arsenite methyltransferase [Thozetella sp. PMI_491]